MKLLSRIFESRLVKSIVSREGRVHFRRWSILESPRFNLYVHQIARSDEERDPHDHPWSFASLVLRGGYHEKLWKVDAYEEHDHRPGSILFRSSHDFHRIRLYGEAAWTLVLTGPRTHDLWGYRTAEGWVDHLTYRKQKHAS